MFLVTFSSVMIGVALVYLTGFIAGGFVGIWFTILLFSGAQVMLVDKQKVTPEQEQQAYRRLISGRKTSKRRRRRPNA
jgi:hypothetical protein